MKSKHKASIWAIALIIFSIFLFWGNPDIQDVTIKYIQSKTK